jgi:hypothetical protein
MSYTGAVASRDRRRESLRCGIGCALGRDVREHRLSSEGPRRFNSVRLTQTHVQSPAVRPLHDEAIQNEDDDGHKQPEPDSRPLLLFHPAPTQIVVVAWSIRHGPRTLSRGCADLAQVIKTCAGNGRCPMEGLTVLGSVRYEPIRAEPIPKWPGNAERLNGSGGKGFPARSHSSR